MVDNDQTLAGRVSQSVVDDVEAIAEEESSSKSTVVRRFVEQGIERHKAEEEALDDATTAGRSVSPLALVGVVSLAIAPTLLSTGYTIAGGVAGVVAAAYVLLWVTATDVVVEEALGDARAELREAGGVVGFFRRVVTDHHVEDPDTVVERAARLDILAFGLLTGLLAVLLPVGAAAWVGVLGEALAVVGSAGATAVLLVVLVVAYGAAVLMGVSAVASLAIASARTDRSDTVDVDAAAE